MRAAISITDALFHLADKLAKKRGVSRSQLYADAIAEYLTRHAGDAVTDSMDRVCADLDARPHPALTAAACRILVRSDW